MSKLFAILIFLVVSKPGLYAQIISGVVKSNKGTAIKDATVSLLKAPDSSLVKMQVSREDGSFQFSHSDTGSFILVATSVGYQPGHIEVPAQAKSFEIVLKEVPSEMKAVIVKAARQAVQIKEDKMIVNVEGTINAIGNNALELLRKSPGVNVNSEERISMNGKNGVQVFIDGKPIPLAGTDLAAFLKSIQSSEIEALELITHPSARYEAAGNAGIINIRLKKNKSYGTNGSLASGFNQGIYGKYNTALSLNHRTARVNIFGTVGFNGGTTHKAMKVNRSLLDSIFDQRGTLKERSNTLNLKAGTDFFIDGENTLGVLINGSFSETGLNGNSHTVIAPAGGAPSRTLLADNSYSSNRNHLDFNLNYLYVGKEGRSMSMNADYGYFNLNGTQIQPNIYLDGSGQNKLNTVTYEMNTPSAIDIYSFKWDYELPLWKGKLATGVKSSYVATDNNFERYTLAGSERVLDDERSNRFVYNEAIQAAYVNYSRQWKHIQLQAGLRAEGTAMKGVSTGKQKEGAGNIAFDSTIRQRYLDLFPSVAINYSKDPAHQVSLSFSRRIDRPVYQELNPFELKVDDYLVQKGNAYLRPQYTHGIGFTYVFQQKLNASLNYSAVKDLAAWILDTMETSKSVAYKQNIAAQKVVALSISYPFQYRNYSMFANLNATYNAFKGDFGSGRSIDQSAFGVNIFTQHSLKFAKRWTAELTAFYYAPSLHEGNMRVKAMWSMDAGVQTKLKEDKITMKLSASDPFNTLQFRSQSQFAGQLVRYNTKNETRQIKLSVGIRLGSSDVKAARQRKSGAEEELKRVN